MDAYMDLDFYQDWWWNLALVAVVFYIGLAGYSQRQPSKILFELENESSSLATGNSPNEITTVAQQVDLEKSAIAKKLGQLMEEDRLYLQPDLNLQDLAQHLQVNAVQLSSIINQVLGQNFNDYINNLRIEEFIRAYKSDENNRFTMLSIALDAGFNSKATFNRAFKKFKGCSPKDYFEK